MKNITLTIVILTILSTSGFGQKSKLKVGKKAPGFEIEQLSGEKVSLEKLLTENGFVLVHFFVGSWLKYDTLHLKKLQTIYPNLSSKNTEVIAITREKPIYLNKLKSSIGITYKIGLDPNMFAMGQYGVVSKITPHYVPLKHKEYNASNYKHTGSKDGMMPIPASYLINKEGKIVWMHFDPDYRQRPDINSILEQL